MKVLHLPFGGQSITMCSALREIGIDATSCHFRQRAYKPDVCLHLEKYSRKEQWQIKEQFLMRAIEQYDIFHFHYGTTFFEDKSDIPIIKNAGKKILIQHRGSDARRLSIANRFNNPFVRVKPGKKRDENTIINYLRYFSNYVDHAIVADYELFHYVKDYYKHIHIIPQAIDIKNFLPAYPSPLNSRPLIIHAPTNQNIKGTDYVIKAVERLREEGYSFDFQLIRNLSHQAAINCYQKADIIIDQLLIGSFGIFSLEAMALGKPTICYIRDDLIHRYPPQLPIVNANPDTIYDELKKMYKRPQWRYDLGTKGRKYVEEYYDSNKIAKRLTALYESL